MAKVARVASSTVALHIVVAADDFLFIVSFDYFSSFLNLFILNFSPFPMYSVFSGHVDLFSWIGALFLS